MKIYYRVLDINEEESLYTVRYFTDFLTENDLASEFNFDGSIRLNNDGYPIRCRTDVSLTSVIKNPSPDHYKKQIESSCPYMFFYTKKKDNQDTNIDYSNLQELLNKTENFDYDTSSIQLVSYNNDLNSLYFPTRSSEINAAVQISNANVSDKILELGCGQGSISIEFAKLGNIVKGIDINSDMINIARQKSLEANTNIEFIIGDFNNFDLSNFDIIVSDLVPIDTQIAALKLENLNKGIKYISIGSEISWKKPDQIISSGIRGQRSMVYKYTF